LQIPVKQSAPLQVTLFSSWLYTFRHLLEQTEDGTSPDEISGPEEMHSRRKVCSCDLLLLHFIQVSVQSLLSISQHHLPTRLHGGLQLNESFSLPGVWDGHSTSQTAQQQTHYSRVGALQLSSHCMGRAQSWMGNNINRG